MNHILFLHLWLATGFIIALIYTYLYGKMAGAVRLINPQAFDSSINAFNELLLIVLWPLRLMISLGRWSTRNWHKFDAADHLKLPKEMFQVNGPK